MKIVYKSFRGINELEGSIMRVIQDWASHNKTPISRKEVLRAMKEVSNFTVISALNSLLKKGYLRRAVIISNKTYYVQLRRV